MCRIKSIIKMHACQAGAPSSPCHQPRRNAHRREDGSLGGAGVCFCAIGNKIAGNAQQNALHA